MADQQQENNVVNDLLENPSNDNVLDASDNSSDVDLSAYLNDDFLEEELNAALDNPVNDFLDLVNSNKAVVDPSTEQNLDSNDSNWRLVMDTIDADFKENKRESANSIAVQNEDELANRNNDDLDETIVIGTVIDMLLNVIENKYSNPNQSA